ncbi:hypothetical protein [Streptomyces sp. KL116D]|uniref:hypothetical protein n=1 Tax=Streptomyces sp. KL116D TaxID=3045152 RepID=UPI0035589FB3
MSGSTYFAAVRHLTSARRPQTTGPNLARKTSGTGTLVTNSTSTCRNRHRVQLLVRPDRGADAAYGAQETWDFYKSTFARNGITEQRYGGLLAASTTATRT